MERSIRKHGQTRVSLLKKERMVHDCTYGPFKGPRAGESKSRSKWCSRTKTGIRCDEGERDVTTPVMGPNENYWGY